VSGQHVLDTLFDQQQLLKISEDKKKLYYSSDAAARERLSAAFLLNLAYWKFTKQLDPVHHT